MAAPLPAWRSPDLPIRVGISSCLLGEEVRYDGGHQKDPYITGVLARHFSWVPVCPELEVGMGVPREPIRLVGAPDAPRLLGVTTGTDHTERMGAFARRRVQELGRRGLSGYVLKRASPSCGMERVNLRRGERPARRPLHRGHERPARLLKHFGRSAAPRAETVHSPSGR